MTRVVTVRVPPGVRAYLAVSVTLEVQGHRATTVRGFALPAGDDARRAPNALGRLTRDASGRWIAVLDAR